MKASWALKAHSGNLETSLCHILLAKTHPGLRSGRNGEATHSEASLGMGGADIIFYLLHIPPDAGRSILEAGALLGSLGGNSQISP